MYMYAIHIKLFTRKPSKVAKPTLDHPKSMAFVSVHYYIWKAIFIMNLQTAFD
jgi:hypothetical protein